MRISIPIVSVLMLSVACKPPAEAPEDLGQLSLFMYENFDSDELESLDLATLNLEEYITSLDLSAKVNDRAVTLPKLTAENLGTISPTEGADLTLQVPVGISAESRHDFATNLELLRETNYICIDSDTSKFSERTFLSDLDCFMDGECETLETSQWVRKENPLGKVWFKLFRDYRRVTLEDGREVMHARTHMEETFATDGGNGSWDQNYAYEAWIPTAEGDKTLRFYGLWSSVQLSLIGDDAWAVLVKGGIDQSLQFGDDFLDPEVAIEDYCKEDRNPDDLTPPAE